MATLPRSVGPGRQVHDAYLWYQVVAANPSQCLPSLSPRTARPWKVFWPEDKGLGLARDWVKNAPFDITFPEG